MAKLIPRCAAEMGCLCAFHARGGRVAAECNASETPTKAEIRALERAFTKAFKAELLAIEALPEKPTKAQADRCWRLADETNKARAELAAARDRAESAIEE